MTSSTPGTLSACASAAYRVVSAVSWKAACESVPSYIAASSPASSQISTGSSTKVTAELSASCFRSRLSSVDLPTPIWGAGRARRNYLAVFEVVG